MGHSNEWHIKEGDSLERTDTGVRAYFHDAMEAMEHGLTASEFRMRELMPSQGAQHPTVYVWLAIWLREKARNLAYRRIRKS